jgi:hypothetical protein
MYAHRLLLVACVLSVMTSAARAADDSPAGAAAAWTQHDLIVNLQHLPKSYSCDDLWYKFRDVLSAIGARPDPKILVYRCGPGLGTLAFSPQVHLRFAIPQALPGAQARWADVNVTPKTVRLEPGHPASIDTSDCELLRQMKNGLLAALPDRVVSFQLACDAPPTRWPFNVAVETLTPIAGQARVAARN